MRELVCNQVGIGAGSGISFASFSEALNRGSDQELALSTTRTSQPEPVEAQHTFEMGG